MLKTQERHPMSELQHDIEQVELSVEEVKSLIAFRDRVLKLWQNKDFQEVIEKAFLEGEAVRLTHLYTDNAVMSDKELREKVHVDLQSVGFLKRFLSVSVTLGNHAEAAMEADPESLDQLRYEEAHPDVEGV